MAGQDVQDGRYERNHNKTGKKGRARYPTLRR